MRVVIAASKLAAAAGMHPFKPRADMVHEFSKRYAPHLASPTHMTVAAAQQAALQALPEVKRAAVMEAVLAARECQGDAAQVQSACLARMPDSLPEAVRELARGLVATSYGTRAEASARDAYSAAQGVRVEKDDEYRDRVWLEVEHVQVVLGGRHDGLTALAGGEEPVLIEVKNRMRRFLGAPQYERIQVMAYMFIFGVRQARLVESFAGEHREHVVEFDEELWGEVRVRVEAFVREAVLSSAPSSPPAPPAPPAP